MILPIFRFLVFFEKKHDFPKSDINGKFMDFPFFLKRMLYENFSKNESFFGHNYKVSFSVFLQKSENDLNYGRKKPF